MTRRQSPGELGELARKTFIDIAKRRQRPGSGSLRDERPRKFVMSWPDLHPALGDIPWAVAGDVATRHYMPERATQNLAW